MPSPNDIKKGTVIKQEGELWVVVDFQRVSPGKGGSFVRSRMKSLTSGKVVEQTFKSAEVLTFEEVRHTKMQYLFGDGSFYTFMDNQNYDQVQLDKDQIGDDVKFLKEGLEVTVIMHGENPIAMGLPQKIQYTVSLAPPAVKGDSSSGNVTKEVELENGLHVRTPIFIKTGDMIMVNTQTGEYAERVS